MANTAPAASPAQISKIFSAAREIGVSSEQVRDLAEQVSGNRSVKELTFAQAGQVIDALVRAGARPGRVKSKPSGRRTAGNETLLITPGQRVEIERLRSELGGDWMRDKYFEGACQRVIKKPRPTSAGNASRVIEMLKARLDYNRGKRQAR